MPTEARPATEPPSAAEPPSVTGPPSAAGPPSVAEPPSAAEPRPSLRDEHGNTMLLMPVGILIMLVLGAIAVDFAVIYLAQREVANVAAGLANDAAGAVDEGSFFDDGAYRIDEGRAATLVGQVLAARPNDTIAVRCPGVALEAPDVVRVSCVGTVDLIFAPALPGSLSPYTVRSSSTARAAED